MITTRGCIASYRKGEDPSTKINAWLEANPDVRLLDVKIIPAEVGLIGDVYVLMILEIPAASKQED